MGSKSKTLSDLFLHQLRDLHHAERHGGKMLGKLAKAATDEPLKAALEAAAQKAQAGVEQLDAVFEQLDKKSHTVPCQAMLGIIEEAKALLHDFEDSGALDAGLVAAAQAMTAYGITRCGALRAWSMRLGHGEATAALDVMIAEKRRLMEGLDRLAAGGASGGVAAEPHPLTPRTAALTGLA